MKKDEFQHFISVQIALKLINRIAGFLRTILSVVEGSLQDGDINQLENIERQVEDSAEMLERYKDHYNQKVSK